MNQEEFEDAINDQLETCTELLFSKSDAYNEGDDKLRNFRVAAVLQGVTIEAALGGMLSKHIVSIYDMIDGAIENYWVGTWEEKIADAINYLLILKAMVAERYRELENVPDGVIAGRPNNPSMLKDGDAIKVREWGTRIAESVMEDVKPDKCTGKLLQRESFPDDESFEKAYDAEVERISTKLREAGFGTAGGDDAAREFEESFESMMERLRTLRGQPQPTERWRMRTDW